MAHYLKDITIHEISGVDEPAQEPAVVNLIKSAKGNKIEINKADRVDLTSSETNGHVHGITVNIWNGRLDFVVYYAGDPNEPYDWHDHAVVKNSNNQFELVLNEGHTHTINMSDLERVLSETVRNKSKNPDGLSLEALIEKGITLRGKLVKNQGDIQMTDEEKKEFEKFKSISAMTGVEKGFYDELQTDAEKDEFLSKSAEDRKTVIDKAKPAEDSNEDDPVVYKSKDGTEVRKSQGDALVKALQKADEASAKLEEMELEKRASTEFGNFSKDLAVNKNLTKALDTLAKADREAVVKALGAHVDVSKSVSATISEDGGSAAASEFDEIFNELKEKFKDDSSINEVDIKKMAYEQISKGNN